MHYKHLVAVGFEIEGGWKGEAGVPKFTDAPIIRDGSINGQSLGDATPIRAAHVGEVVSPIITLEEPLSNWRGWLTNHWPDADPPNRTNRTCGFHIHLSVKDKKLYTLLTTKEFLYEVRERFKALGERLRLPKRHIFWERLDGFNRFCQLDFDSQAQFRLVRGNHHGHDERYGFLNFAWGVYGTVELRVLPTFRDAAVAERFVETYLDFVEEFLEQNKDRKLLFSVLVRG